MNEFYVYYDVTGVLDIVSPEEVESANSFITVSRNVGYKLLTGEMPTGNYMVVDGELKEKPRTLDVLNDPKYKKVKVGKRADVLIEHNGNKVTFYKKEGVTEPSSFIITNADSTKLLDVVSLPRDERYQATLSEAVDDITVWCEKISKVKLKASE